RLRRSSKRRDLVMAKKVTLKDIRPELSAQGVRKQPNPMLDCAWSAIKALGVIDRPHPLIVDYGCGQLRNTAALLKYSKRLLLVDTSVQLNTPHEFFGRRILAKDFAAERWPDANLRFLDSTDFERARVFADVIFLVNVFDVVPTPTRIAMVRAVRRNLRRHG